MFRSKKGALSDKFWSIMLTLLLVMAIMLPLLSFIYSSNVGDTFRLNYIATDVALLLDTLQAVPSDVTIIYPHDTEGLAFDFRVPGRVQVYHNEGFNSILSRKGIGFYKKSDAYAVLPTGTITPDKDGKTVLMFAKAGRTVDITNTFSVTKKTDIALSCIGAGAQGDSKAVFIDAPKDSKALNQLADSLKDACGIQPSINCNADASIASLHLIIKQGTTAKQATAAIPPGSDKSAQASCLVLNALSIKGFTVKPAITDSSLSSINKPALVITLSSEDDATLQSASGSASIARAIAAALKEYYGTASKESLAETK